MASGKAVSIAGSDRVRTAVIIRGLTEPLDPVVAARGAVAAVGGVANSHERAIAGRPEPRVLYYPPAMAASVDDQTIQAVLDGDADRFAELVDRYQEQTLKLAFSLLGNYEDAKDASQEAFVSAYRSLRRFRGGAKFSTWLFRMVVNVCKDVYKRRARLPVVVAGVGEPRRRRGEPDPDVDGAGLFVDVEDPAASPSDQLANRELGHRLSAAITGLPMKQRTAFLLHHVHGLPLAEVASVMHCRLGTVKSHIFRATDHLKEAFS
ncbi:MAG: RNA polymerase sigma factor [Candidatus Omnitrophota bacterium]|nr:RNA polymerase sigma factor [Candidatus Omnitrophota bacterium]